ncbi:MAG: SEL1-like repeat protein [Victivallales bacterium]|nr:SEL1-like repeat protein [Victivallales bacterium]
MNIKCESCGHDFSVNDEMAGQNVECPNCHEKILVKTQMSEENNNTTNIKRCPNCGHELLPDALFCVKCGTKTYLDDNASKATEEKTNNEQNDDYLQVENNVKKSSSCKWRNICKWINAFIIVALALFDIFAGTLVLLDGELFFSFLFYFVSVIAILLIYLWLKSKKTNIINVSINVVTSIFVIVTLISFLNLYDSYNKYVGLYSKRLNLDEQLYDLEYRINLLNEANFDGKNYFNYGDKVFPERFIKGEVKKGIYDWEYLAAWKEAMLGSCIEQYSLGVFFRHTQIGGHIGMERAYYWFLQASLKTLDSTSYTPYKSHLGCVITELDAKTEALNNLAMFNFFGWHVPRNHQMTVKYYEESANLGNTEAAFHLGRHYEDGDGVEQDFNKAFKFYYQSADAPFSQYKVGQFYLEGKGITQDIDLGLKWLFKAVYIEHLPQAQCFLGELYLKGEIVHQDDGKARELLEAAKNAGQDRAVLLLQELDRKYGWPK